MERIKQFERIIARVFGVEDEFSQVKSQKLRYTYPKKVLCMVLWQKEEMKQEAVAKHMGYAGHSNVSIHVRRGEELYELEEDFRDKVDQVFDEIYNLFYKNNN